MAERVGFEPTVPGLAEHTISSRAPSANSGISPHFLLSAFSSQLLALALSLKLSNLPKLSSVLQGAISQLPAANYIVGGEGGIRTHVPGYSPDKSISSRPRYDHFGTSPQKLLSKFTF